MVIMAKEKRIINELDAEAEFDGRWVLLDERDFPPSDGTGYIVAYGDGTPEDRDALMEIKLTVFKGRARLMKGYVPKDGICDSGIIEVV